ncbi:MAG: hypothetical protein ACE5PO_04605 [Candidatus Bathyarchaeia archaeon]
MSRIPWREELPSRWSGGLGRECSLCGRDLSQPQNNGYFELMSGDGYLTCEACYTAEISKRKHLLHGRGCKTARLLDAEGREIIQWRILAEPPWVQQF